jgi:hypothetical protein
MCIDNLYIQSNATSAAINYSNGQTYYNLSSLSGLTDYTSQSSDYSFVRLKYVSFEITRVVDEATMSANNSGALWLLYAPTAKSFSAPKADLVRNQAAYQVDLMTFDKQTVVCPFANIQDFVQTGADYTTQNNSIPMHTGAIQYINGQLSLYSDNAVTNASTRKLFSILVKFHCEFYYRV